MGLVLTALVTLETVLLLLWMTVMLLVLVLMVSR